MLKLALKGNGLALQVLQNISRGHLHRLNQVDIARKNEYVKNPHLTKDEWEEMFSQKEIDEFYDYLNEEGIGYKVIEHDDGSEREGASVVFHYKSIWMNVE